MFKVIIAGGREFKDYDTLRSYCDHCLKNQTEVEIVSGCANGADKLGERYAMERGYAVAKFAADWNRFSKRAGYIRNTEMGEYADALIAFWDGESKGTKHMIDIANNLNLKVKIYYY